MVMMLSVITAENDRTFENEQANHNKKVHSKMNRLTYSKGKGEGKAEEKAE